MEPALPPSWKPKSRQNNVHQNKCYHDWHHFQRLNSSSTHGRSPDSHFASRHPPIVQHTYLPRGADGCRVALGDRAAGGCCTAAPHLRFASTLPLRTSASQIRNPQGLRNSTRKPKRHSSPSPPSNSDCQTPTSNSLQTCRRPRTPHDSSASSAL